MTTLVHTCPDGPSGQQVDLLTSIARSRSRILTLDSSLVDNASVVSGASVTEALNNLSTTIGALNSNQVLNASGVAGVSVTDALNVLSARTGALQSQIGYVPGAGGLPSNVLTLRSAGHTPGLYLVAVSMICRSFTAGAPSFTPVVSYTAPTLGATTQSMSLLHLPSGTGPLVTQVTVTGVLVRPPAALTIESDGSAAITVQILSTINVNTFDVYAGAALLAS